MADPLSILPLAVAAAGGTVDGLDASQLAGAGVTLLQRSAPLVRALAGKRSAILLPTSPAFFVALAASDGRGAVLVNPLAAPAEIAFQLADAGVGAVFTNGALATRLPDGVTTVLLDHAPRTAHVIAGGVAREVDLGAHHGIRLEGAPGVAGLDEDAAVVYTSAMAGTPLGARLTHRNLLANGRSCVEAAGNSRDDRVLALLPFAHLFGLTVTGTAPLLAGAAVVTMERFHPFRTIELLERDGITEIVGVPAVFGALLAALDRRGGRLAAPALRLAICGGAVLPVETQDRWFDRTGVELRQGYGLTEAGPVSLFNRVSLPNRRGSLGVPFPDVRVSIRAVGDAEELPEGTVGEICVAGENVFAGYVGARGGGLEVRDGWLRTGDLGRRDSDGAVTFAGLAKPMFTRNGFNVYPRELERVIAEMPGVTRVFVHPIPDPTRENDIGVVVAGDVTEDAVRRWCEARLSAYKQPSAIEIEAGAA